MYRYEDYHNCLAFNKKRLKKIKHYRVLGQDELGKFAQVIQIFPKNDEKLQFSLKICLIYNKSGINLLEHIPEPQKKFILKKLKKHNKSIYKCSRYFDTTADNEFNEKKKIIENLNVISNEYEIIKNLHIFLTKTRITPHLLIPITQTKCDLSVLFRFIQPNYRHVKYKYTHNFIKSTLRQINNSEILPSANFIVAEWVNGGTISEFIEIVYKTTQNLKKINLFFSVVTFQLIYTFACIEKIYPHFRHNDLHLGNIFCHLKYVSTPQEYKILNNENFIYYRYENIIFKIPDIGLDVVIADFGKSKLKDENRLVDLVRCLRHIGKRAKTCDKWLSDILENDAENESEYYNMSQLPEKLYIIKSFETYKFHENSDSYDFNLFVKRLNDEFKSSKLMRYLIEKNIFVTNENIKCANYEID